MSDSNLTPNKERLQLVVNALTSGEYKKVKKCLYDGSCFCVQGVMCDLYQKETGNGEWKSIRYGNEKTFLGSAVAMSQVVEEWYGLTTKQADKLMNLNDSQNYSFKRIAQFIEETYLAEAT